MDDTPAPPDENSTLIKLLKGVGGDLKQPATGIKLYPGKGPTVQPNTPFANWAQGMGESGKDQLVGLLKHPENLVGTGELGAALPSQIGNLAKTTFYHGTRSPNIKNWEVGYNSWGNKDFKGNHRVISFSTDPEFAGKYAGNEGSIYPVRLDIKNPGNFENPEHRNLLEKYLNDREGQFIEGAKAQRPDIWTPQAIKDHLDKRAAENNKFVGHGAWQKWENPDAWKKFGWDSAWSREDPFHRNKEVLNMAVHSGKQVLPLYQQQMLDLLKSGR